ncbi:hypothetical protein D3C80_2048270 [compost metagenome]
MRAIAFTMSVDSSITVTPAVPSDERISRIESKSMSTVSACSRVITGQDAPPGMMAFRLPQPPRTPPP